MFINSIISGSIAMFFIMLIPLDSILRNKQVSVAPTEGYGKLIIEAFNSLFKYAVYLFFFLLLLPQIF